MRSKNVHCQAANIMMSNIHRETTLHHRYASSIVAVLHIVQLSNNQLSKHSLSLFRHKMGNLTKYIRLHMSLS